MSYGHENELDMMLASIFVERARQHAMAVYSGPSIPLRDVCLMCRRPQDWDPMQHAMERLEAAVADRRGSAEEITALFVALLRSHSLAVRFVRCEPITSLSQSNGGPAQGGQRRHAWLPDLLLAWCVHRVLHVALTTCSTCMWA